MDKINGRNIVMESYDKIKKTLAIAFMHELDANRPEGKMCLSNGECADIEKAFNEQDWPRLAGYLDKYTESEDEKTRKAIVATIEQCPDDYLNPKNRDRMLTYLEKQKEQTHLLHPKDMDYEKKYNEALKRAKDFMNGIVQFAIDPGESIVHYIFPELRESENERIRQFLIERIISLYGADSVTPDGIAVNDIVSYLEKQKEPVLTSIWKDTKDEIAPTKRGILGWYRKADGKLEGRPYIVWFCSEEEASKESEPSVNGTCLAYWAELPNEDFKKTFWCDEPKPAEWSEEDDRVFEFAIARVEIYERDFLHGNNEMSERLKALHPRPSWKPSEEQMSALLWCIAHLGGADRRVLSELYEHLKMYCK